MNDAIPTVPARDLVFVTAVSKLDVFQQRLCASPCLQRGGRRLVAQFNVACAAQAFNDTMTGLRGASGAWLVWVHQDVVLPPDWDTRFLAALNEAQRRWPRLAVAGVYGLAGSERAGHVLDRGRLLREALPLPCAADSLDELLFAVRADSGLALDAALGFDFYATDLVLQAQAKGLHAAVVDAYCEHWSDTPTGREVSDALARRILASGHAFEAKWAARLPVHTSWLTLRAPGDVERFVRELRGH